MFHDDQGQLKPPPLWLLWGCIAVLLLTMVFTIERRSHFQVSILVPPGCHIEQTHQGNASYFRTECP